MRILEINDFISKTGGAETIFKKTIKLLKEEGHDVFSLSFDNFHNKNHFSIPLASDSSSKLYEKRFSEKFNALLFNPFIYLKIRKIIKIIRPDVIHLHNYNLAPLSVLYAIKGYNTVQTVHASGQICPSTWGVYRKDYRKCNLVPSFNKCMSNCFYDKPKIPSALYYMFHRRISNVRKKVIRKFIFPSKALLKGFSDNGFTNLFLVRNPFNYTNVRKMVRKENILMYAGKMSTQKGVGILIDALIEIKDLDDWQFVFAGEGDLKESFVKRTKYDKRFVFTGNLTFDKLKRFYEKSKIMVVPSLCFDNYPTVILEGRSYKCIVLGSNRGGIPEMIGDEFVFSPDKESIRSKISYFAKNYEKYVNSFDKATKDFCNDKCYVNKLIKIFKMVI